MGGVYQYSSSLVQALVSDPSRDYDVIVFSARDVGDLRELARRHGCRFVYLGPRTLGLAMLGKPSLRSLQAGFRYCASRLLRRSSDPSLHTVYLDLVRRTVSGRFAADLMLYPRVDFETFHNRVPFIASVHDLQHRINPQYPEVSSGDLWEWREVFFRNACTNALSLFVDSEIGREDVMHCYGTPGERITILPYLPPDYLQTSPDETFLATIRAELNLPSGYLFYPAQFWPHKNHLTIVKALARIQREKSVHIPLVLCGGKGGAASTFDRVMQESEDSGVREQIRYLGYIDDKYLAPLYKDALALIMPTAFGPTNIPVLEAWRMGCPVITSDIRGCREQASGAAVLVDPLDEKSTAEGIWKVYSDKKLRKELIAAGTKRLARWDASDFSQTVRSTVSRALNELRSGKQSPWRLITFDDARRLRAELNIPMPRSAEPPAEVRGLKSRELPRISVITPSFNSGRYLEEAIRSVLDQRYPNVEHIVVDGGSTDGTIDILRRHHHLRWLSRKDHGQSDAMNKGFLLSTGDIITYLNADDFYEPGAFFKAAEYLDRERGKLVVAGMCNVVKPDGSLYVPGFVPKTDFYHMMFWWNAWFPINPASYFYFREVQQEVGGYDVADHYLMDYEFLLKVSLRFTIHPVAAIWGNFRWLESGKSYNRPAELSRKTVSDRYFHHLPPRDRIRHGIEYLRYRANTPPPEGSASRGLIRKILKVSSEEGKG
jgi:glycosyltransferase involved in cell wall biosynthesis